MSQASDYINIKKMRTIIRDNECKNYGKCKNQILEHNFIPNQLKELNDIVSLFYESDYDKLSELITFDKITSLKLDLFNYKKSINNKIYLREIEFWINLLDVLYSNLKIYLDKKQIMIELEYYKEKSSILDNPDKLKQYIAELNKMSELTIVNVKVKPKSVLSIDPVYYEYHKLYGLPINGIYIIDLLEKIGKK